MIHRYRWFLLPLAATFPALVTASACGSRSVIDDPGSTDAGSDAPDAKPDVVIDSPKDAPPDTKPDAPVIKPGLGAGCDGTAGNPDGCETGLQCYTGTDPQDEPDRWPGGYCTHSCNSDSQCAAYGGVCSGGFSGQGRCLLACDAPTDCRQGYACKHEDPTANTLACAPTGFIATRGAGVACFQSTDPSAVYYAPALPLLHFEPAQKIDTGYFDSNEVVAAVNDQETVVAGANAIQSQGYANPAWHGDGNSFPVSFAVNNGPQGSGSNYYSDPYVVTGKDGAFYYSTLGLTWQLNAKVLVGRSADQGKSWQTVQANPASDCTSQLAGEGGPCIDHPWLAIGPDKLNPTGEALYAAYLATHSDGDAPTVLIRSVDGGKTWGIPGAAGQSLNIFSPATDFLFTNLITPIVDDLGNVHIVASGVAQDTKGSVFNSVQYTRSEDGGKTRIPPVRVNPVDQAVPYDQAVIGVDAGVIYVVYSAGENTGAWDIILAQSTDGQSWSYEKVNDDPEPCATHFHPTLAIDHVNHKLYVGWYDGRFAPYEGSVAVAVCDPSISGKQCGANERVNDQTFFITTDRNGFAFIGDYFTLASRPGGRIWAAYGDTRQNDISHAYVARGTF